MRNSRTHIGGGRILAQGVAIVCAITGMTGHVNAQDDMVPMAPQYIVTTTADAVLRAGDSDNNYVVATPPANQILRADAARDNWYRVSYPVGSSAYVKAEDATPSADGASLTVKHTNAVKAMNTRYGVRGSWRFIRFEPPIDSMQALKVLSTEQDANGKIVYVVELPLTARACIHKSYVRVATPAEIADHDAAINSVGLSYKGEARGPAQEIEHTPGSTQPPTTVPHVTDTPQRSDSANTPTDTSPQTPEQLDTTPSAIDPTPTPENGTPVQPGTDTPRAAVRADPYEKYRPLLSSFDAVQKQDIHTAEFGELVNEYQIAMAELDPLQDDSMRSVLGQRLEILLLRKELQKISRDRADQLARVRGINQTVEERMLLTDPTRKYNIIGRLETSAVYNGVRMPMMYRIQSVGEAYPRTLAYIKPTEQFPLGAMVGRVVGVVGQTRLSQGINLNVVTPTEIETLQSIPTVATPVPYNTPAVSPSPAGTTPGSFVHVPDEDKE